MLWAYCYHEVMHGQKQFTLSVGTWNVRVHTVNSHCLGITVCARARKITFLAICRAVHIFHRQPDCMRTVNNTMPTRDTAGCRWTLQGTSRWQLLAENIDIALHSISLLWSLYR